MLRVVLASPSCPRVHGEKEAKAMVDGSGETPTLGAKGLGLWICSVAITFFFFFSVPRAVTKCDLLLNPTC